MAWTRSQGFNVNTEWNGTGAASTAATLGTAVAVGDLLVLTTQVGVDPTTLSAPTVTDQLGNTYTRLTAAQGGQKWISADLAGSDVWFSVVTTAGTPTITWTPSGGVRAWISICGDHFTGSNASSVRDASAGQIQGPPGPGTGVDVITSGAATTTSDGDLVWCFTENSGNGTTSQVAGTGFSAGTFDTTVGIKTEFLTQVTHGSVAGTWTDATNGGAAGSAYTTIFLAINAPVGAVDRDVIVRYGNMGTTTGSGLVMAAFLAQATTAAPGGYYEWYYTNVVQDGV